MFKGHCFPKTILLQAVHLEPTIISLLLFGLLVDLKFFRKNVLTLFKVVLDVSWKC